MYQSGIIIRGFNDAPNFKWFDHKQEIAPQRNIVTYLSPQLQATIYSLRFLWSNRVLLSTLRGHIKNTTIFSGEQCVLLIDAMIYSTLGVLHYYYCCKLCDRFSASEKSQHIQHSYMPFGSGPRSCIGMRFALLEAKIALIEVLKRFTFCRAADTEVRIVLAFNLRPCSML